MKTLLVAFAAALLAACGSAGTAQPAQTIVVHEDTAGHTVHAHVNDVINVELTESFPIPGSSLTWDATTSAPSVLKLEKVTRDPAERPRQGTVKYTAEFSVIAAGQATLFVRGAQTCEAMPSCPQKDFTVAVVAS
jgi:uncharacterized lipoprotein